MKITSSALFFLLASVSAHAENFSEFAADPIGMVDDIQDPKRTNPDGTTRLTLYNRPSPQGEAMSRNSDEIAMYCNPDGCGGYFVFASEGEYYKLMTNRKIFAWIKQTEVARYRTLESFFVGLTTHAQFPIKVWKEAGEGPGETFVGNQLIVIPENLKFTHTVVIKPRKGMMTSGFPTPSDQVQTDKAIQMDFTAAEFMNVEASPGVKAALVLDNRTDWLRIRMQDHPPHNGKTVWIKRNNPQLGEIKPINSTELMDVLKKAEINTEDLKVPVIMKAVGAKRIGNRLWMDVGFISHDKITEKDQEKIGCEELRPPYGGPTDPRLKPPGLLKRGWIPLRDESGHTVFDPFKGCK